MTGDPFTRRRFLRLGGAVCSLGSATLAGCSSLQGEPQPVMLSGEALEGAIAPDVPTIPRSLPVDIEASFLDSLAAPAREELATVPTPLDRTEVPNGAIRRELTRTHERARSHLDAATSAPTPFEAVTSIRRARGEAATLAAAWNVIEAGLSREAVIARGPPIRDDLDAFVDRWAYVGASPIRVMLVHAHLEQAVLDARESATVDPQRLDREPANAITIGELAGELSRAATRVRAATYLYDRFQQSIDGETDLRSRFEGAAHTLVDDIHRRRREIPTISPNEVATLVDGEISDVATSALEELYFRIEHPNYPGDELAAGRPAHAIEIAHVLLARFRAFTSLRTRLNEGESFGVSSVSDVEALRSRAMDALNAVRTDASYPQLTTNELARLAEQVRETDRRLTHHDGDVRLEAISYEVAGYVFVDAVARAVPPMSQQVASTLEQQ